MRSLASLGVGSWSEFLDEAFVGVASLLSRS